MKEVAKAPKKAPAASSTVQALKKKYQEQRLISKTRSGVLNKLAQKGVICQIKMNQLFYVFWSAVKDKNLPRVKMAAPVEKKAVQKKKSPPPKPAKVVKTKPEVRASPTKSHKDRYASNH
jgi:hypothetical protein